MGAAIEVQRALFTALSGAGLTVCDFSRQVVDSGAASGPVVEIGHIILTESDTQTTRGFDVLARIHTRSRSTSAMETKETQDAIYAALHRNPLPVTGQNTVLVMRETSDCTRLDGSFHGVCEYRGLLETL